MSAEPLVHSLSTRHMIILCVLFVLLRNFSTYSVLPTAPCACAGALFNEIADLLSKGCVADAIRRARSELGVRLRPLPRQWQ